MFLVKTTVKEHQQIVIQIKADPAMTAPADNFCTLRTALA